MSDASSATKRARAEQSSATIAEGDAVPSGVTLDHGFPPSKVDLAARVAGKTVILLALEDAGVDEVLVWCVNDGAVMKAWAADQKVNHASLLTFMGDPTGALTRALGMELTHEGPRGKGLIGRCKRHALLVVDGKVTALRISEADDDPAGDDRPEATCAPALLDILKAAAAK
eukprot:g2423.t1